MSDQHTTGREQWGHGHDDLEHGGLEHDPSGCAGPDVAPLVGSAGVVACFPTGLDLERRTAAAIVFGDRFRSVFRMVFG